MAGEGISAWSGAKPPCKHVCQCDRSIRRGPEKDSIARYRTVSLSLKTRSSKHSQHISISRDVDDTMHSTVIRIHSGTPFAWKYCNACVAAVRLAADLAVPCPRPMR